MTSRIITTQSKNIKHRPEVPNGYEYVNVLSWHKSDTKYYEMSPYFLKTDGNEIQVNDGGVIFENFWQGSKVYPIVYPNEVYPHYSKKGNPNYLLFKWDTKESHYNKETDTINYDKYLKFRSAIFSCKNAIRYPNGYNHRSECVFSLIIDKNKTETRYGYQEARENIYVLEYVRLVRKLPIYMYLLNKLKTDPLYKICISEVDVPSPDKKGHYKIPTNYFDCTLESIQLLIKDTSCPFGHGLALAYALLKDLEV